jgi:hypothetical protein
VNQRRGGKLKSGYLEVLVFCSIPPKIKLRMNSLATGHFTFDGEQ